MRNSFSLGQNKNTKNNIDVLFAFDGRDQYARPVRLTWRGADYWLGSVQFWYAEHKRGVLVHHYQVSDENGEYTFDLSLETENLTWQLDRVTEPRARTQAGQVFVGVTA